MLVIATIGPSTNEKLILRDIIDSGANMIRLNFSHGRLDEFEENINIAKSIKSDIKIMQDLSKIGSYNSSIIQAMRSGNTKAYGIVTPYYVEDKMM